MEKTNTTKYGLGWIFQQTKGIRLYLVLFTVVILIATGLELSFAFFLKEFVDIATGESNSSLLTVALLAGAALAVAGVLYMLSFILSKYIYGVTYSQHLSPDGAKSGGFLRTPV